MASRSSTFASRQSGAAVSVSRRATLPGFDELVTKGGYDRGGWAAGASAVPVSVVVPAHNEARTVARCLRSVLADAQPGEFEVVVVANGCSDDTEALARSVDPAVGVVVTPTASKPHALDLGDQAARWFPRLYVDADVEVSTATIRELAAVLDRPGILAAAPRLALDVGRASRFVKSYHRIWCRLPSVRRGLAGRGVYGMSEAGRSRFGSWPSVVADDFFVDRLFDVDEQTNVSSSSVVAAPGTLQELVARKARVFRGNLTLHDDPATARYSLRVPPSSRAWLGVVRSQPGLVRDAPVYVAVTMIAKGRAWLRVRSPSVGWDRPGSE